MALSRRVTVSDIYSAAKRSEIMSRVRSTGSKPEMLVRRLVHSLGYRFRLHHDGLPGKPDLAFPRHRKVIFVHGCFWHQHGRCAKATIPASNHAFWERKLSGNVERDRQNVAALCRSGWQILVIWECETRDRDALATRVRVFLESPVLRCDT